MNKNATITWHPVRLVPFDPARHAKLSWRIPKEVWEGEMPGEEGRYLVATVSGFVRLDEFAIDGDRCWFETYDIVAWAELPEPYVPEDDSDAKE